MMRKRAIEEAGGYRQSWFPAEDRELWMRMLETWHGANVPQILHKKRKHTQSVCAQNLQRQSELGLDSTIQALARRRGPADVPVSICCAAWARGELFAAFGLAARGDPQIVGQCLEQALALDVDVTRASFAELLQDRVAAYMHIHGADVPGARALVRNIFYALPEALADLGKWQPQIRAQIHAIAAFYHARVGQRMRAQREALMALAKDRSQWRDRGLIKLALGMA
jgi:hypothetical protein